MPGLEAAACRCPVVATRCGGPEDYVEDGVSGYLVDVGDAEAMADRIVRVLRLNDGAVRAMSEAMYGELKPHGIDVVIMQPVAMKMDRPATGAHLHLVAGVAADSPSHRMLTRMDADTAASKLTPEAVAEKVYAVITSPKKRLRVPMDRARALTLVKRLAPQSVIDRLLRGLTG